MYDLLYMFYAWLCIRPQNYPNNDTKPYETSVLATTSEAAGAAGAVPQVHTFLHVSVQ